MPPQRRALAPTAAATRLYQISFRPGPHLLARGNDPLRLFRELRALGELTVTADLSELPPLHALDPESCYLSWTLQLRTGAARATVLEVFDWAMGDCALEVTGGEEPEPAAAASVSTTGAPAGPRAEEHDGPAHAVRTADAARGADATSIRVSIEKIDDLMNSVGELVITQSMLGQFGPHLEGAVGERSARRAGAAGAQRARAAGERHACAHGADQFRVQPLSAHGARSEPAPGQAGAS